MPWLNEVLLDIKKDIKTDYLPKDMPFYRAYFGSRPQNRLSLEEINQAFIQELLKGNEEMSEWVVNRWVFKHGDLYQHFAVRMEKINPNFEEIKSLSAEESESILAGAVEAFGAKEVYFFAVLNGVVFPKSILERLASLAKSAHEKGKVDAAAETERLEMAKVVEKHQREVARLIEKYEQKIEGVMKKYTLETEGLKKQVRALQKQIACR